MRDIVINTGPIILKAKKSGLISNLGDCIARMRQRGIWVSAALVDQALREASEP